MIPDERLFPYTWSNLLTIASKGSGSRGVGEGFGRPYKKFGELERRKGVPERRLGGKRLEEPQTRLNKI